MNKEFCKERTVNQTGICCEGCEHLDELFTTATTSVLVCLNDEPCYDGSENK